MRLPLFGLAVRGFFHAHRGFDYGWSFCHNYDI
jgi:hypothetical protein